MHTKMQQLRGERVCEADDTIDASLDRIELMLGAKLPAEYREFVALWGGTAFNRPTRFGILGSPPFGSKAQVAVFFGILTEEEYDLRSNLDEFASRLDGKWLPVASDPGGNLICLSGDTERYGQVWFWDHEAHPEEPDLWKVAESWPDFINALAQQ